MVVFVGICVCLVWVDCQSDEAGFTPRDAVPDSGVAERRGFPRLGSFILASFRDELCELPAGGGTGTYLQTLDDPSFEPREAG